MDEFAKNLTQIFPVKRYFTLSHFGTLSSIAMNQNVRLLRLDCQIRDGHYPNAKGFAAQCDCTSRQVHYDRKRLIEMGAPLAWDAARKGWFYTDPTWSLPAVYLNEGELLAFSCRSKSRAAVATPDYKAT